MTWILGVVQCAGLRPTQIPSRRCLVFYPIVPGLGYCLNRHSARRVELMIRLVALIDIQVTVISVTVISVLKNGPGWIRTSNHVIMIYFALPLRK